MKGFAKEFSEILPFLSNNDELRLKMVNLIDTMNIQGKVTEEETRKKKFKTILKQLINKDIPTIEESYNVMRHELPRTDSRYESDNRVFAKGWEERHIKTQLSRFYNQAVLELLKDKGAAICFIYASSQQDSSGKCALEFINKEYKIDKLLNSIIKNYEDGNWDKNFKLPEHPHCSHVAHPL